MVDQDRLAPHLDAMYAAAREDFTAVRRDRAKRLRAEGHAAEAATLETYRKPTMPAWAVNQLARREPERVAALLAAALQLGDAQRRAAAGLGSDGLREATRDVRRQVTGLCDVARALLTQAGARAEAHLDAVDQTLFAAAVDPAHHELLERGLLSAPLESAGFGGLGTLAIVGDSSHGVGEVVAPPGEHDLRTADQRTGEEPAARQRTAERREAQQRARAEARRRAAEREALEQRRAELLRSRTRQERRTEQATARLQELQARVEQAAAQVHDEAAQLDRIMEELAAVQAKLDAAERPRP